MCVDLNLPSYELDFLLTKVLLTNVFYYIYKKESVSDFVYKCKYLL